MDPMTLIALFGPLIKSGGQALINKFSKGDQFKPANVTEAIQLMQAESDQLKARISAADTQEPAYQWVASVIKLQRPIIVYLTICFWLGMVFFGVGSESDRKLVNDMASIVIFWLFGERTLLHINNRN
jgi:hypothetical protein